MIPSAWNMEVMVGTQAAILDHGADMDKNRGSKRWRSLEPDDYRLGKMALKGQPGSFFM